MSALGALFETFLILQFITSLSVLDISSVGSQMIAKCTNFHKNIVQFPDPFRTSSILPPKPFLLRVATRRSADRQKPKRLGISYSRADTH